MAKEEKSKKQASVGFAGFGVWEWSPYPTPRLQEKRDRWWVGDVIKLISGRV
jgi:hypothetical protein